MNNFENELYHLTGKALCMIQDLEDCLNRAILIKTLPKATSRNDADQKLDDYRNKYKYTFGKAISIAEDEKIFEESTLNSLRSFSTDRNWLVHKSIAPNRGLLTNDSLIKDLLTRIQQIGTEANNLCCRLEEDLIKYCTSHGADIGIFQDC